MPARQPSTEISAGAAPPAPWQRRDLVYWPSRAAQAIPWALGPVFMLLLSLLGLHPTLQAHLASPDAAAGGPGWRIVIAGLVNYMLLVTYIHGAYLTLSFALLPALGTLGLLTALYGVAWAIWTFVHGTAPADPVLALAGGSQVLSVALLFSLFWKADRLNADDVLRHRDVVRPLLRGDSRPTAGEYERLLAALRGLATAAGAVGRVTARQQRLLDRWRDAAVGLAAELGGREPRELPALLATARVRRDAAVIDRTL